MINFDLLEARKSELSQSFALAKPFRWMLVDGFLEDPWAQLLYEEFGGVVARSGKTAQDPKKHKHVLAKIGIVRRTQMHEVHRQFFDAIQEPRFLRYLEDVTGIRPILADPMLVGGGLHEIHRGGYLDVHVDFNVHPESQLHRRLNILFYLNPVWKEGWEGELQLWPADLSVPLAEIAPIMNRMAIFETSEVSYHGHPKPLRVPDGVSRRSMAAYYYSTWPEGLEKRAKTRYRLVPWQVATLRERIGELRDQGKGIDSIVDELSATFERNDIARVLGVKRTQA